MIVTANKLDNKQKQQIKELVEQCLAYDHLERDVCLDEDMNYYEDMDSFYLYYKKESLVSVLTVFCPDGKEVEISGYTHPHHRRKGYFLELLDRAEEELVDFDLYQVTLVVEPSSVSGRGVADICEAEYEKSEYMLQLDMEQFHVSKQTFHRASGLTIRRMEEADLEEAVSISQTIFQTERDFEYSLLEQVLLNENMMSYLAYLEGRCIGICNLEYGRNHATIFGIGILPEYQGKGYGRELFVAVIEKGKSGIVHILLSVSSANRSACGLYKSLGFTIKTQYDYYIYCIQLEEEME